MIGTLYASILSEAGADVTVYARGRRLAALQKHGVRYKRGNEIREAQTTVISKLEDDDCYDFVFLTVRENQLRDALRELRSNVSPTIVTMVNSLDAYTEWEDICGRRRILPAFPGAGGGFDGDVLDAALTPRIVQPTTIGRTDGRERVLADLLKKAKVPCEIVDDMHAWQVCHLAMVVPLADAYYEASDPVHAGSDRGLMRRTASQIKENFRVLVENGTKLSPAKMNVFKIAPVSLTAAVLGFVFRSSFGDRFMYQHSMKAPDEMKRLHDQFYGYMESHSA